MANRTGEKLEMARLGTTERLALKLKDPALDYDVFADIRGKSEEKRTRQTASANDVLSLSSTQITGSSPRSGVAGLRSVHLAGRFVTDNDLGRIANTCPALTCLDVSNNPVTDAGVMQVLKKCLYLSKLYIFQTSITDKSFSVSHRNLKVLGPSQHLTSKCIQALREQGVHVEVDETMTTELLISLSDMIFPLSIDRSGTEMDDNSDSESARTKTASAISFREVQAPRKGTKEKKRKKRRDRAVTLDSVSFL